MENDAVSIWLEKQEVRSGAYCDYLCSMELDDTFGWGDRLDTLLENEEELPAGVLITGPEGCGRHTIMINIIQILKMGLMDFGMEFITGWDLEDDTESFRQAQEKLDALLNKYGDQSLCLILDELEKYPYRDELLHFLEKTACEYRTQEEYPALFLVLIQNEGYRVPAILKKLLYPCRVQYPDAEHRKHFLVESLSDIKLGMPVEIIAEMTEGFSYADLQALEENTRTAAQADPNNIIQNRMEQLIAEQKRPIAASEGKKRLYQKLEQTLDSLPELLAKFPQREADSSKQEMAEAALDPKTNPLDPNYMANQEEELNSLPGHDLVERAVPKETLERIRQK